MPNDTLAGGLDYQLPKRVASALASSAGMDELLEGTYRHAVNALNIDSFFIALFDRESNELDYRIRVEHGIRMAAERAPLASSLVASVLKGAHPVLVSHLFSDSEPTARADEQAPTAVPTSWLGAPLVAAGDVVGVISVQDYGGRTFGPSDQATLTVLAAEATAIIEKARLVDDLKQAYSDLSRMQSQILQSRNTLRALFDNLQDEMYIVDRQFNILAINQSLSQRVGSGPQNLVGRCCYRSIYHESTPCATCLASAVFPAGTAQTQIIRRLTDRGPEDVESSACAVTSPEGTVTSAIVMNRDVTERRRIEATLFESAKLSAVGQLAASLAHEISNPLTVITGNVQYLLTEVGPDHPHFELLQLSERAARRANRVIRTLLDFSRQEAYEFVPIDLNTCIDDALSLVSYQLSQANITVTREFGADLPSVVASASHLQTIWTNLLLNARDAMPRPAGGEIRITTALEPGGTQVRTDLTDTGQGIAPDHVSHIFEPFFTTKPVGKGTGLGLHVVHNIVERHGGRVTVHSLPGSGTTFSIWLPTAGSQQRRPGDMS